MPAPQRNDRSKSPSTPAIILLTFAGIGTHLIIGLVLLALFGAVLSIDDEPLADGPESAPPTATSTNAPTTTTAPPTRYVVESVLSGDSVVVTDGVRKVTVTIAGIDAPEVTAAHCWSAEAMQFATDTLLGKEITFGAVAPLSEIANLVLTDGRDFASLAITAGAARAMVDGATEAILTAEATAKAAGAGLWGQPCLGQLTMPPPPQPVLPPAPVEPRPEPQPEPRPEPQPEPEPEPEPEAAYYGNCDAARAAGAAPLYRGDPGYRSGLDRDGDGVACE